MIAKSVFDYSWMDEIARDNKPILIILEGLLVYFKESKVKGLLNKLVNAFEGAENLSTIIPPFVIEKIPKKGVFSKMGVEFKWGIKSGREMEKYNSKIKFIEEWIFMDYHQSRWETFKWSSLIPKFKNKFSNRITHLKFN